MSVELSSSRTFLRAVPLLAVLLAVRCAGFETGPAPLTADVPLHLEDHLDAARIVGSEVPAELPAAIEWRFDEPQPDWKSPAHPNPHIPPLQMTQSEDALRVTLSEANRDPSSDRLHGDIYVPLPDLKRGDWGQVLVRARTSDKVQRLRLGFNLGDPNLPDADQKGMFQSYGDEVRVIRDGSVQTYLMRADWLPPEFEAWEDPWQELGFSVVAEEPASIDILSVSVIPIGTNYAAAPAGVREEVRGRVHRRALYAHAPGRIEYRVRVPEAGRLDLGLGVLRGDASVTFEITATPEGGEVQRLFEEAYHDPGSWAQRSVDLSHLAGQTVTLGLGATAQRAGTVVLWGAPTLSGTATTDLPNIVFYIIDGGGAAHMSVYGYNRRTTPNMDRLAAEGAVFENAYSNSHWTKPSTASFMTSLQHSVLGGYKNRSDRVPEEAVTMAEHMHGAGYQTAVFVANPYAGTLSGLERGVDWFQEEWTEFTFFGQEHHAESSRVLHEAFWSWREASPATPYWVHFQTTDVHSPWTPVAPFAGLFVSPEMRESYGKWAEQLRALDGPWHARFENTGIDRFAYHDAGRDLYDEAMAHQDHQLGQLVERLKAGGEWERTLLIVAADHGTSAAGGEFGRGMQDPAPPEWWPGPMFRMSVSRIPLMVVWPGRIAGGQRFSQPVSMIDVLPTILDLVGLPMPEVMQGQSLAPLLSGEEGWEPRPVILDQFDVDQETGEFRGQIEVIDGRWGASLEINPAPQEVPEWQRPVPLLVYDLWNDPMCLYTLHDERPDLVKTYTKFLEAQFEAHQSLAEHFTRSEDSPLTPEQLRTLRSLGYIQ